MAWIFAEPAMAWLILGVVLITVEALTVPGIGLFLAGLGAIATALLIEFHLIGESMFTLQLTAFFILTALITLLLWKPLQRRRRSRSGATSAYHNLIGTTGTVGARGLSRDTVGQVVWSGTRMNAVIDPSSSAGALPEGTVVTIVSVEGNTLSVSADSGVRPLHEEPNI